MVVPRICTARGQASEQASRRAFGIPAFESPSAASTRVSAPLVRTPGILSEYKKILYAAPKGTCKVAAHGGRS